MTRDARKVCQNDHSCHHFQLASVFFFCRQLLLSSRDCAPWAWVAQRFGAGSRAEGPAPGPPSTSSSGPATPPPLPASPPAPAAAPSDGPAISSSGRQALGTPSLLLCMQISWCICCSGLPQTPTPTLLWPICADSLAFEVCQGNSFEAKFGLLFSGFLLASKISFLGQSWLSFCLMELTEFL